MIAELRKQYGEDLREVKVAEVLIDSGKSFKEINEILKTLDEIKTEVEYMKIIFGISDSNVSLIEGLTKCNLDLLLADGILTASWSRYFKTKEEKVVHGTYLFFEYARACGITRKPRKGNTEKYRYYAKMRQFVEDKIIEGGGLDE